MQCSQCKYWKSYGHSNRGSCEKLLKSFGLEAISDGAVNEIRTRGDFGCMEFSKVVAFEYTPEGFKAAKEYLELLGLYQHISTHGFSTDGLSIVHEANSIFEKRNGR